MPNVFSTDKQVAVISALAEGSGIRQIERITGVHRDTIMRLGVRVGKGCANVLDRKMRNLSCNHLQFDEIWTFKGKTVWDGVVEVFELIGHPKAPKVYARAHDTDDPKQPRRHVTVLHIPPVVSPVLAVRAAIVQEFRNAEAES